MERGRATLLGDAAHATTPTVGQGACQALEDVVVLVRCLERGTTDVVDALLRYESERRRRAEDLVALSRRGVERLHAKDESNVWRVVPSDPSLVRASDHPDHRGLARQVPRDERRSVAGHIAVVVGVHGGDLRRRPPATPGIAGAGGSEWDESAGRLLHGHGRWPMSSNGVHRVVIVGGGFVGLRVAKSLVALRYR